METVKENWLWFMKTSTFIGMPVTIGLIFYMLSKTTFTFTCVSVGYKCEYAVSTQAVLSNYFTSLVGGEAELEVKPRGKNG